MLYSIALEIAPSQKLAEQILTSTFLEFYTNDLTRPDHPTTCMVLIKLLIKNAHRLLDHSKLGPNLKVKRFEAMPVLHQLICQQQRPEHYCEENAIPRSSVTKIIRDEFNSLRVIKG